MKNPRTRYRAPRALRLVAGTVVVAAGAAHAAPDLDELALLDLEGRRVVAGEALRPAPSVVLFWSLYQPESRHAVRALDALAAEIEGDVRVVGIEVPEYREGPDAIEAFAGRAGLSIPLFVDPAGGAQKAFGAHAGGVDRLPATYLIEKTGEITLITSRWTDGYVDAIRQKIDGSRSAGASEE